MTHITHTHILKEKSLQTTLSCYQRVFLSACPWERQSTSAQSLVISQISTLAERLCDYCCTELYIVLREGNVLMCQTAGSFSMRDDNFPHQFTPWVYTVFLHQALKMFENIATVISYLITHSCILIVCSSAGILSLLLLITPQTLVLHYLFPISNNNNTHVQSWTVTDKQCCVSNDRHWRLESIQIKMYLKWFPLFF